MRTNYLGADVASFQSLAFGDGTTQTVSAYGPNGDNSGFALLEFDPESSTDHAQDRQYGYGAGRWLSPDPYSGSYDFSNPQSLNRYSYVLNNPVAFNDPRGLKDCPIIPFPGLDILSDNCSAGASGGGGGIGGGFFVDIAQLVLDLTKVFDLFSSPQFQGSPLPRPQVPNNGNVAKQVTQDCLAQYNNSTAGKAVQFFSLYNLATNFKNSWPDWTVLPALKFLSLQGLSKASQAIGNTEIVSVTGGVSTEILSPTAAIIQGGEKVAGSAAVPGIAGATGLDILANAGCGTLGREAAGQMTPLPPGVEVSF